MVLLIPSAGDFSGQGLHRCWSWLGADWLLLCDGLRCPWSVVCCAILRLSGLQGNDEQEVKLKRIMEVNPRSDLLALATHAIVVGLRAVA